MATGDTVLRGDRLHVRADGLAIALTVPWYRSLWLSSVSGVTVAVDGKAVPTDALRVELGDRVYRVDELPDQWDVLWFIQDRLVVVAPLDGPPASTYDVEVSLELRLPYMQIAPLTYVTNHATNRRTLAAADGSDHR